MKKSKNSPSIDFELFLRNELPVLDQLMGETVNTFKASANKTLDQLKLHNIIALHLQSTEHLEVFRTLFIWFALRPSLGHVFKCCDRLAAVDEDSAKDLLRATTASTILC